MNKNLRRLLAIIVASVLCITTFSMTAFPESLEEGSSFEIPDEEDANYSDDLTDGEGTGIENLSSDSFGSEHPDVVSGSEVTEETDSIVIDGLDQPEGYEEGYEEGTEETVFENDVTGSSESPTEGAEESLEEETDDIGDSEETSSETGFLSGNAASSTQKSSLDGNKVIKSGSMGEHVTYELYDNNTLYIRGYGDTDDFSSHSPLYVTKYREDNYNHWNYRTETVVIEPGITSIGNHLLDHCRISSISIPDSVTRIGDYAFAYCSVLPDDVIPPSVTEIGNYAFYGCDAFEEVILPSSVESIGSGAFYKCEGLRKIVFPDSITVLSNRICYECVNLSEIGMDSVTEIGEESFYGCDGLTELILHDGLTTIGKDAFCGCLGMTKVWIPDSVTEIGEYAFQNCHELLEVRMPNYLKRINNGAFGKCWKLEKLDLPEGLEEIGRYAFTSSELEAVTFPASLKKIEVQAYDKNSQLKTVTFRGPMPEIELYAFRTINAKGYHPLDPSWNGVSSSFYGGYILWEAASLIVTLPEDQQKLPYTGADLLPNPVVTDMDGKLLIENTDYTLAYENNREVGKGTVIATGIGDYVGLSGEASFLITGELDAELKNGVNFYLYEKSPVEAAVRAFYGDETLTEGEDYTISFRDNEASGKATAVVEGCGTYTGTVELPYYLVSCTGLRESYVYTGKEIKPEFGILYGNETLVAGTDYLLSYDSNINPGPLEATINVSGYGLYIGSFELHFDIVPRKVCGLKGCTYTQRELRLTFTDLECAEGYRIRWWTDSEPNEIHETDVVNTRTKEEGQELWLEEDPENEGTLIAHYEGKDSLPYSVEAYVQVSAYANMATKTPGVYRKSFGEYSETVHFQSGNQIIRKEMWGFINSDSGGAIDSLVQTMKAAYGQVRGRILRQALMDGGRCQGMVHVGAYSFLHGDCFGHKSLQDITDLDMQKESYDAALGDMDADTAISYMQNLGGLEDLYDDFFSYLNKTTPTLNLKLSGFVDAVASVQQGKGTPIGFLIDGTDQTGEYIGHFLMAMGIAYEDNYLVQIDVYDPNYGADNDNTPSLYLYKVNGSLDDPEASWSYYFNNHHYLSGKAVVPYPDVDGGLSPGLYYHSVDVAFPYLEEIASDRFTGSDQYLVQFESASGRIPDEFYVKNDDTIAKVNAYRVWNSRNNQYTVFVDRKETNLLFKIPTPMTIRFGNEKIKNEIDLYVDGNCTVRIVIDNPSRPRIEIVPETKMNFELTNRYFRDNLHSSNQLQGNIPTGSSADFTLSDQNLIFSGISDGSFSLVSGGIDTDGTLTETDKKNSSSLTLSPDGLYSFSESNGSLVVAKSNDNGESFEELVYHTHVWGEENITKKATCAGPGTMTRKCRICEAKETSQIPAVTVHSWTGWSTKREATALNTGLQERSCNVCGKKETRNVKKLSPVLKLNKTSVTIQKTASAQVGVTLAKGDSATVKSSDTEIASARFQNGIVTITAGTKAGTAKITVTTKTKKTAVITVTIPKAETTKITCKSITVKKGKKKQLKPVLTPIFSDDKVIYKVKNKKIAKVSKNGVVKGKKKGKTTVTITSGKVKIKVKIRVK